MKSYWKIIRLVLLFALSGTLFYSCVWIETGDSIIMNGSDEDVVFSFRIPASMPDTRALDVEEEYNVDYIDVLVFEHQDDGDGDYLYQAYGKNKTVSDDYRTVNFNVALRHVKNVASYDFVILANARQIIADADDLEGLTKTEVQKLITMSINAGDGWITDKTAVNYRNMPMWGEFSNKPLEAPYVYQGVTLNRMTVKVDFAVVLKDSNGNLDKVNSFDLEEVWFYNYNTKGLLIPDADDWSKSAVSVPADITPSASPINYSSKIKGGKLAGEIYTFEAAKGSVANYADNVCLVVKGSGTYDGEPISGWYRIDFATYDSGAVTYTHLKRNHFYDIAVARISGDGYDTKELAFSSKPGNVEVTINSWNQDELNDIISDGQYMLQVDNSHFNLYNESSVEKLSIRTNYDVAPNAGWKISEIELLSGSAGWISIPNPADMAGDANVTKTIKFKVEANNENILREANIVISAGKIEHKIKVVQTEDNPPQTYDIRVTQYDDVADEHYDVDELVFEFENSVAPEPERFNVRWSPVTASLRVSVAERGITMDEIRMLDGMNEVEVPDMLTWREEGYTFIVLPDAAAYSGDDPFYERSAKMMFALSTPSGLMTKSMDLRHTNHNLKKVNGTFLMNGKQQTLRIRSNFTWKVELESITDAEGTSYTESDVLSKPFQTQYGGHNTASGDPVMFTFKNYLYPFDENNPILIYMNFKFYRLEEGEWIEWNEEQDIACYSAVSVGSSNTYMINNNSPVPIIFNLNQIKVAMGNNAVPAAGFLGSNWIKNPDNLKVQVLWTDHSVDGVNGSFGEEVSVVQSAYYIPGATLSDSKVLVVPGSSMGNALVILYEDNDGVEGYRYDDTERGADGVVDKIRWSWHIWNTDYFPYRDGTYPGASYVAEGIGDGGVWMRRNIGANSDEIGNVETLGYMYQWGRKDPFPPAPSANYGTSPAGTVASKPLYYAAGSNAEYQEVMYNKPAGSNNLGNSIVNPFSYYYTTGSPSDWYINGSSSQNKHLWGGDGDYGYLNENGKSVYDPCPEGFKIPKRGVYGELTGNTSVGWLSAIGGSAGGVTYRYGQYSSKYGGYYPAAGARRAKSDTRNISNVGNYGGYWYSSSGHILYHGAGLVWPNYETTLFASAQSVRCVKE